MSGSLIGSVSISDNTEGVYLGAVSIVGGGGNNWDLGAGVEVVDNVLSTIGNPDIQLVSNSLYVNDGVSDIQTAVTNAQPADVIYVSSGSYGGDVLTIESKSNIAIMCPTVGGTICELVNRGVNITGTSTNIRLTKLQIEGSSLIRGDGRTILTGCVFVGTSGTQNIIEIGAGSSNYFTFENCEFNQYCIVRVAGSFASLASVCYFINCNFQGATLDFLQPSPLQVILNNCAGLPAILPSNCTPVGVTVNTNNVIRLDATTVQCTNLLNSLATDPGYVLTTNASGAPSFQALPSFNPSFALSSPFMENIQQLTAGSATAPNYLVFYSRNVVDIFTPFYKNYFKFIVNFDINSKDIVRFDLIFDGFDITSKTVEVANGHNCIPIIFDNTNGSSNSHSVELRAYPPSGKTISFTTSSYISFELQQAKPT
jgi:hypothetical protein